MVTRSNQNKLLKEIGLCKKSRRFSYKYLVGSSIKIKWGLPSIAIAAQSFLFVPPLRSWHLFIAWACRSRSSIDFFTTWINDVTFVTFVTPLTYIFILKLVRPHFWSTLFTVNQINVNKPDPFFLGWTQFWTPNLRWVGSGWPSGSKLGSKWVG